MAEGILPTQGYTTTFITVIASQVYVDKHRNNEGGSLCLLSNISLSSSLFKYHMCKDQLGSCPFSVNETDGLLLQYRTDTMLHCNQYELQLRPETPVLNDVKNCPFVHSGILLGAQTFQISIHLH